VGSIDSRPKVALEGPSGMGPDVFIMAHDNMGAAVTDGICEPFSDELFEHYRELILETALKTCVFDDILYGVPVSTENIAFFYNKTLLGNSPVPTTFEEVIAFADQWNNPRQGRYALRWPVEDPYYNYFFLTAGGMSLFGPDMDDYKNPGWDSESAADGLRFYRSLRRIFDIPSGDTYQEISVGRFIRGEVPFTITGPWHLNDMKRGRLNFGVTKLPTINGNQPRCFSGAIVASVSSFSKNKEAAFAFIEFLTSTEGITLMYRTTGKLAAYKDISGIEGLRDDPYLKGIQEQSPYADPMPVIPEMAHAWDIQKNLFVSVWNNTQTIEAAQKTAMSAYDTALLLSGKRR
jgi:arabinogalactan oligomer/maltooligosaccharide transport system substrate-binding protein